MEDRYIQEPLEEFKDISEVIAAMEERRTPRHSWGSYQVMCKYGDSGLTSVRIRLQSKNETAREKGRSKNAPTPA